MEMSTQSPNNYTEVLHHVIDIVTDYAHKNRPSPTIKQLAIQTGYSEECILESMEYGKYKHWMLLQ